MKLACLTVSKRTGWGERAADSVLRQTVLPYQWVVVTEKDAIRIRKEINPKRFTDRCRLLVTDAPDPIRLSNLNRSLNYGLKFYCHAKYVIFYQDFIDLQVDCFEKLLAVAAQDERTFVTTATINDDGTDDSRYLGIDKVRQCRPEEWEANVAIAPMKILKKLGGFDEEYDNGWSWDNCNVAERAAMLGCRFLIDETNRPQLLYHPKETSMPTNGLRHAQNMAAIRQGRKPLKLKYLTVKEPTSWDRRIPKAED